MTIEATLMKVAKVKPKPGEKRPAFLERLVDAVNDISEDKWEDLPLPAQNWCNDANTALKKGRPVKDFPDAEDDDDETETPTKAKSRAKPAVADEDEDEDSDDEDEPVKPTKRGKPVAEEEDDEDEDEPADEDDDEDDAEQESTMAKTATKKTTKPEATKPKAATKTTSKPAPKGTPKAASKPAGKPVKDGAKGINAVTTIRRLTAKNPSITNAQIAEKLEAAGLKASTSTVSAIRGDFLAGWKELHRAGIATRGPVAED